MGSLACDIPGLGLGGALGAVDLRTSDQAGRRLDAQSAPRGPPHCSRCWGLPSRSPLAGPSSERLQTRRKDLMAPRRAVVVDALRLPRRLFVDVASPFDLLAA
eukprot:4459131-Alexandrium_andersonii.AAC.1